MEEKKDIYYWIFKTISTIVLIAITFFILTYFQDAFPLTQNTRIAISTVVGILFFILGGPLLKWIQHISFWS
jgi:hypothetical protein